jgi:hypothetical protein
MKPITWFVFGCATFFASCSSIASTVKWTDENGTVHYSDQPPQNVQIKKPPDRSTPIAHPQAVPVQAKSPQTDLQPWQQRRMGFAKAVQGLGKGDSVAHKSFEAVLNEFETKPFSRTPMENMEILGAFYIPKDGVEKALPIVIANAILGWYDALRFTSESGRAEITNNEGFFKKAFVLGGQDMATKTINFLKNNPELTAQALAKGLTYAERFRDTPNYDRRWPTAYGLEKIICATGGSCKVPPPMPKDQWNKAWDEAKQRVSLYYQLDKTTTSNKK